jgi:large subunit ribosomal protein L4
MPTLKMVNIEGKKTGEIQIPETLLDLGKKEEVVNEVIRMYRANRRRGTASTKTRGEVKSSGRKPWRQKGTGRARVGDRGSPLWRGGGVIFGPRPRNFSFSVPKKVRREALKSALVIRFQKDQVVVIDEIKLAEPRTRILVKILKDTGAGENVLILTVTRDKHLHLASRNLPTVETAGIRELNILSVLSHPKLLITREALGHLQSWMEKVK